MFKKIIDILSNAIELVANIAFAGSVLLVVMAVALTALKVPTPWADEGACFLYIWTVFLAAAIALRKNTHIRIDVLLNRVPPRMQGGYLFFLNILCLVFCLGLLYGIYQMLEVAAVMRSPAMEISMVYYYLPLFIGFVMMAVYLTQMIGGFLKDRPNPGGGTSC
jgi:TRAP-type C4-dicarboxylate transport system permease small subunit